VRRGRLIAAALCVALVAVGLLGAYRYWESYYRNRGFATVAYLPHARRGRLLTVHFFSPALHRRADYLVYLPPGYGAGAARYPVYYLLHGSPGRPQVYLDIAGLPVRMDNLIARRRMRPMILVFADGRIGGSTYSDSEWANTPSGHYESYVLNVVKDVDHRFATLHNRDDRVIAGFSSGAYGATNIALRHLGTFAGLQSWSGYYKQTRSGVFARAETSALAANSPADYVARLRRRLAADPFRALLFVGRDDNVSPQTQPMARALGRAGASVSYALYPGGHDWQLWHAHLNRLLILVSRYTSEPLPHAARTHFLTPGVRAIPHGLGRAPHDLPHGHGRHRHRQHRHRRHHVHHRHRHSHHRRRHHRRSGAAATGRPPAVAARVTSGRLLTGLLLAVVSAALINLGFLLQHRGLRGEQPPGARDRLRAALRNRTWLSGQAVGWLGFLLQIVAVAIAPLSLVQAFAAGGLAISVPLAAGVFGHSITRAQRLAVLAMALGLAILPLGFSGHRDHLHVDALVPATAVGVVLALALSRLGGAWAKAVAAGMLYGVADAAVKGISVGWRIHGPAALVSGWTALAAAATFGGFLAFQAALQSEGAVSSISLMTATSTIIGMSCGVLAFGESLGTGPLTVSAHLLAIAVVLGCVPVLAAAQAALAAPGEEPPEPPELAAAGAASLPAR
jgi:enterochelin esterase-like enzyme